MITGKDIDIDRTRPQPIGEDELRARAVDFVEESGQSSDPPFWKAGMEADGSGDGGLLKEWLGAARVAPAVGGSVAIFVAVLVCAGWSFDIDALKGKYFGAPGVPVSAALLLGLLGTVVLLLRSAEPVTRNRRTWRDLLGASLALVAGLTSIFLLVQGLAAGADWIEKDAWSYPSIPVLVVVAMLSLALITLDRDAPRFRWVGFLEPLLGVMVLAALLSHGYQVNSVLDSSMKQEVSYTTALVMVVIYISYACLRPDRGLVGFLLAQGPGPSMARYLVPTAILIPVLIGIGEFLAGKFGEQERMFGQGGGEVLVLITLMTVIAVTSKRLQGYYRRWLDATSALAEQAEVLRGMSEGVAVVRVSDSRIVLTNTQFDEMHGHPRDALVGSLIDELKPDDLSAWEMAERDRVGREMTSRGIARYESRTVRPDSTEMWCRCTAELSEHPIHGPVMTLVKSDITEERRAVSEVKDAQLRFRQVFEQSPIGLCLVRPDGRFDHVNAALEKITGYSANELYELSFADITHPDDLELDVELSAAMFSGRTDGFEMEKRYIRKDGDVVWIFLTARMLKTAHGRSGLALSMIEDITDRHELGHQLRHLADHDPLTGLYNRRRFEDELIQEVGTVGGRTSGLAVLNVDLDNFKFINDTYGHSVGDQLIIRTGAVLKEQLRETDTLARQGGDEFVVVLRDIEREAALGVASKLAECVARDVRYDGAGYSARVTASIGVAHVGPQQDIDDETLMIHADVAMYEAKDAGRNGAQLFDPQEESSVSHTLNWVGRIRTALDRDGFVLFAQPLAAFEPGGPPIHELFLRMVGKDGSMIAPGAFLPVAERHDLIQEIDRWVVREAIGILAGMDPGAKLCVNLSGRSVGDSELLALISNELARLDVDPSGLIFEVTETTAIGNISRAQSFAVALAELGCRFALDDFGTGFASFYYLKHIACDYVKIDGEFVRHIANDPTDRLLVRALVEISRGMGKSTVAEQVEDEETMLLLRGYGVDYVQGFHIGRPRPVGEIDLNSSPVISTDYRVSPGPDDPGGGAKARSTLPR